MFLFYTEIKTNSTYEDRDVYPPIINAFDLHYKYKRTVFLPESKTAKVNITQEEN